MKKMFASVLAVGILVCLLVSPVLADGKLKITDKNMIVYPDRGSGIFVARAENVGDAPIGIDCGSLVAFSEDDEIILSDGYVSSMPSGVTLCPGEYLYLKTYLFSDVLKSTTVSDYKFSITSNSVWKDMEQIPCEAVFEGNEDKYYDNYILVTFTNTSDEIRSNFYVSGALYAESGELLFADYNYLNNIALHPGATLTVKISVDADLLEYCSDANLVPAAADGLVCWLSD